MIERARKIPVALRLVAEDGGDHFLIGRAVENLSLVPIAEAEHFRTISIVAAALSPQLGRLQRRHQHLDRPGAVLFLANNLLDLLQHSKTQRKPRVNAGSRLPHETGPKHQLVTDDLGVRRTFPEDGQKGTGPAHCAAL